MKLAPPLLYFLRESENAMGVFSEQDFISSDDLSIYEDCIEIPRTSEHIWIYEKLTKKCRLINEQVYNFEISGFGKDISKENGFDEWVLSFGNKRMSTFKLNVFICMGPAELSINHGSYTIKGSRGTLMVFPSYLWFNIKGNFLFTVLSGDPFR